MPNDNGSSASSQPAVADAAGGGSSAASATASAQTSALADPDFLHSAQESPFIADPNQAVALNMPVQYVRRVEEAQRVFAEHRVLQLQHEAEWKHGAWTVGFQCCWIGVGSWVVSRGLRYSDPVDSVVARWVKSKTVCRLTTPVSCVGWVMVLVTFSQLPTDFRMWRKAGVAWTAEDKYVKAALMDRAQALREGGEASRAMLEKEQAAFESNMKSAMK